MTQELSQRFMSLPLTSLAKANDKAKPATKEVRIHHILINKDRKYWGTIMYPTTNIWPTNQSFYMLLSQTPSFS